MATSRDEASESRTSGSSSPGTNDQRPIPLTVIQYAIYPVLLIPWLIYYSLYTLSQGELDALYAVLKQRLGWYDELPSSAGTCIWLHAVSVGEVMCIPPIVEQLNERYPETNLVVTTSTLTGQRVARENITDATVSYFPLDLPSSVRSAFRAFDPELVLLVEQEIWPTFIQEAHRRNVPVTVVNGRMTARSASRFQMLPQRYRHQMFGGLSGVIVQNEAYAERFRSLGVPSERVHISGNVKYDAIVSNAPDDEQIATLQEQYGISSSNQVLVGGSIHPPEEEALLDAFERLREKHPQIRLILAPRHLKNTDRLQQAARDRNLSHTTHDALSKEQNEQDRKADVIIVDTMGVLATVYGLGDLVFVGGSLIEHGGQNMLEPAVLGKPIITGPHTSNFRDEVELLKNADGLEEVQNNDEFIRTVQDLFDDPDRRHELGQNAKEAIRAHSGAARRTIDLIEQLNLLHSCSDTDHVLQHQTANS
jgi:3-deoxy-D-manno-octulosonic-acid transferase